MKQNYSEGTWFAVPLKGGGFCVGVIARAAVGKPVLICYFFGPRRDFVPKLDEISTLMPASSILVLRVGDFGLIRGEWPIIGKSELWRSSNWPMPVFIRTEPIPPFRNWRVYYSEKDPSVTTKEELETDQRQDSPRAGLSGAGAVESKLTVLLEESAKTRKVESPSLLSLPEKSKPSVRDGPFRVEVLSQLRSFGSDTAKPHSFDFYLYFPSEAAALDAAQKIRESEFTAKITLGANGNNWLCLASKVLVPESAPLDDLAGFLNQIATASNGEFDGWESNVVKD